MAVGLDPAGAGGADIAAEKARLRAERLAARDAMPDDTRAAASLALARHAARLALPAGCIVSAFLPIRSEIDPRPLLGALDRRGGIRIGLPIILKTGGLFFRAWTPGDALVPLGFGTSGPAESAPVVEPDLVLAPLSAFDRRGGRIGYGKAHYDQTIARFHAEGHFPRVVGLAFACQEVDAVPVEPHDIPLEAVLTEAEWIDAAPAAGGEARA